MVDHDSNNHRNTESATESNATLYPSEAAPPGPAGHAPRQSFRLIVTIAAALGILLAGIGIGLAIAGGGTRGVESSSEGGDEASGTALEQAKEVCARTSEGVEIGDGGTTLIIHRAGAEERSRSMLSDAICIFDELGVPDSVRSHIDQTRALDGRQEAEFGDYSASWTYHPDNGLNMTITIRE